MAVFYPFLKGQSATNLREFRRDLRATGFLETVKDMQVFGLGNDQNLRMLFVFLCLDLDFNAPASLCHT